jgi:hypothetical protein
MTSTLSIHVHMQMANLWQARLPQSLLGNGNRVFAGDSSLQGGGKSWKKTSGREGSALEPQIDLRQAKQSQAVAKAEPPMTASEKRLETVPD